MNLLTASAQFPGVDIEQVAIIEMSFNEASGAAAAAFYEGLLGINPITMQLPYLFKVTDTVGLMLVDSGQTGSSGTTIYWKVKDGDKKALEGARDELIKLGCNKPTPIRQMAGDTFLCTLTDPAGDVFGLIINPPVPLVPTKVTIGTTLSMPEPVIEPTHVINPPVTAD